MRRTTPASSLKHLRTSRRSVPRHGGVAGSSRCGMPGASTLLQVSMQVDDGEIRSRARLGLDDPTSRDLATVIRAYTAFILCASGAEPDGEHAGLRQTTWSTSGGLMITEIRSESSGFSSARVGQILEPVLNGYASGVIRAARILGQSIGIGMTVDVTTTRSDDGATVLRVVLQGATEDESLLVSTATPSTEVTALPSPERVIRERVSSYPMAALSA